MQKVLILGAGTFALEVEDLIGNDYHVVGYAVNVSDNLCTEFNEKPVFNWPTDLIGNDTKFIGAMISTKRKGFIEQCKGFDFINVCRGTISPLVKMGNGIVINRGAVISAYTTISDHVIINRGALIGHHNKIDKFVTIGPGVNLAGNVTIKERTFIGIGAIVLENITIGKNSIVGGGSVVTKNIPSNSIAMGNPAKRTHRWELTSQ